MVRMAVDGTALPGRVGRYEVVLPIGSGRRSRVVLARASGLGGFDRYVALKLPTDEVRAEPDHAKAIIEDAKRIANLRHNHVVPVYDVGEDERQGVFLVTEYVPGESLAGLRRLARDKGEPLPKRIELRILVDALSGVHAAHEHESETGKPLAIVHRGLSPRSILVGTDGIARVSDFGVAGSDPYLAPEQRAGQAGDRRADVWAAGVIAWEILSGEPATAWEGEPPRLDVAADLADAVARALKIDPDARTATAAAFAKELSTAARAAALFAESDEVAEHVARLAGPELAKRREKLAETRQADEAGASEKRTIIGMAAPPPPSALPPLPEVPAAPLAVPDAPLTYLALKVDLSEVKADRASEAVLGPADQAPAVAEAEPEVYRSPVAPPVLWKRPKVIAGAAIGAAVLVLIVVLASRGGRRSEPGAGASVSATLSAPGSAQALDLDAKQPRTLHITADGPVAKVAIGERAVDVVAARAVDVELLEPERGKSLRVVVTGTDGRVATATADPGVRGIDVTLDPNALPPPPPPKTSTAAASASAPAPHPATAAPREKRTWPKRGPRK